MSISNATFIIGKYHAHSLNYAIYFPLIGYTKSENDNKLRKSVSVLTKITSLSLLVGTTVCPISHYCSTKSHDMTEKLLTGTNSSKRAVIV